MQIIKETVAFSHTHKRTENQDYCFSMLFDDAPDSNAKLSILCVMDGVSQANGGQAVKIAAKALRRKLAELLADANELLNMDEETRTQEIFRHLRSAICSADSHLQAQQYPDLRLATTISLAAVFDDAVYTANVGDSPIYLLKLSSEDGVLPTPVPLYQCQNKAGKAVEEGQMTEEEALTHDWSNYLYCNAGGKGVQSTLIHTQRVFLGQSSIILLGTDGALSVFPKRHLVQLVDQYKQSGLKTIIHKLFDDVKNSESTDNFTVLAQWTEDAYSIY